MVALGGILATSPRLKGRTFSSPVLSASHFRPLLWYSLSGHIAASSRPVEGSNPSKIQLFAAGCGSLLSISTRESRTISWALTPEGHTAVHAMQLRHRYMWSTKLGLSSSLPSTAARTSATRPRGELVSVPASR